MRTAQECRDCGFILTDERCCTNIKRRTKMITITEGLSEINLIKKKIEQKREFTKQMIAYPSHLKDPYAKEGGSRKALMGEQQSLLDLNKRLVEIRSKISKANLENTIEIDGVEKYIFDWLTWKREVYKDELLYLQTVLRGLIQSQQREKENPKVVDVGGEQKLVTLIYNIDIGDVQKDMEKIESIYHKLDGLLSLKNATIKI